MKCSVGQIIYRVTKTKTSWYPEERDDWQVPEKYLKTKGKAADSWKSEKRANQHQSLSRESSDTVVGEDDSRETVASGEKIKKQQQKARSQDEDAAERGNDGQESEQKEEDPNIVTWYGPNDSANPQNWSLFKKCFVTFEMCLLTFSIYIGSA